MNGVIGNINEDRKTSKHSFQKTITLTLLAPYILNDPKNHKIISQRFVNSNYLSRKI